MKRDRRPKWSQKTPPARELGWRDAWFESRLVWRTQWRSFMGSLRSNPESAWGLGLALVFGGPLFLIMWNALFWPLRDSFLQTSPGPLDGAAVTLVTSGFLLLAAATAVAQSGEILSHSGTMPLLFTLPLRSRSVLGGLCLQQAALSAWALLLSLAPVLAFLSARRVAITHFAPVLAALAGAYLVMISLAVFAGATVVRGLPSGRWREWILVLSGTVGMVGWQGFNWLSRYVFADGAVATLGLAGRWLPGWLPLGWPGTVAAATVRSPGVAWAMGAAALLAGVALAGALVCILDPMYRNGMAAMPTGGALPSGRSRRFATRVSWWRRPALAMARREVRRLLRAPRLLGSAVMMFIPAVFPAMTMPADWRDTGLRVAVPIAMMVLTSTIAAAMVGSEQEGFWITRVAPMQDEEIVWGKAWAVGLVGAFLATASSAAAGLLSGWSLAIVAGTWLNAAAGVLAGTGIGMMAGCSDPVFRAANRTQFIGIMGALSSVFGSLLWGGSLAGLHIAVRALLGPVWNEASHGLAAGAIMLALNGMVAMGMWSLAAQSLQKVRLDR